MVRNCFLTIILARSRSLAENPVKRNKRGIAMPRRISTIQRIVFPLWYAHACALGSGTGTMLVSTTCAGATTSLELGERGVWDSAPVQKTSATNAVRINFIVVDQKG